MRPARECLQADYPTGQDIHFRLIIGADIPGHEGITHVALEPAPPFIRIPNVRIEAQNRALAVCFRQRECKIRIDQQILGITTRR